MKEANLEGLVDFLKEYSYLFDYPNKEFFSSGIIGRIDTDWLKFMMELSYADLNRLPLEYELFLDCPATLKRFFSNALEFSILLDIEGELSNSNGVTQIKAKKLYELELFSALIGRESEEIAGGIDRVVDVGCGMGKTTALISLHGCGDLQSTILNEFVSAENGRKNNMPSTVPLLMTIGCCYHKMSNFGIDKFMSKKIRAYLRESGFCLTPITLRLSCQERISRWTTMNTHDHEFHKQNFFNRALVDCLYKNFGIHREEQKRSVNRNLGNNLDELVDRVIQRNKILDLKEAEKWRNELKRLDGEYRLAKHYIEPFTALQFALQAPLETLILWDRVLFLRENGCRAYLKPVFNSKISPRNMCLVGHRS